MRPNHMPAEDSLARGPGKGASANQMHVEMEDGLSGAGADVEDGAVSLLNVALAGDLGGGEVAAADNFCVGGFSFFQSGKMLLGNDEHVGGGLRVDVFEGENVVVL